MLKKLLVFNALAILIFSVLASRVEAQYTPWNIGDTYSVNTDELPVYSRADESAPVQFELLHGMEIQPNEVVESGDDVWLKFGEVGYFVKATADEGHDLKRIKNPQEHRIVDIYGILDQPHRYAIKLVKQPGAVGRIETYKKIGDEYVFEYSYDVSYRKEGMKDWYGDLKSPGGNVVRYVYRTTRSGMNGRDAEGEPFGVYKVSYPMPHDALPHVLSGKLNPYHYNKLPGIYYNSAGELIPHPHSNLGADIVIHTKNKGSRGCINIENEEMSFFYNHDLVTENDHEIIPLIIYDEWVEAPPIGTLM